MAPAVPCVAGAAPDAAASGFMRHHKLEALHSLQASLKGISRLYEGTKVVIIRCLDGEGGNVGSSVEERRFREVERVLC
jgi:hypothetical protein